MLKSSNRLDQKKLELYNSLIKARISLNSEIITLERELNLIESQKDSLLKGQIKVSDTVYPGVKIIIGNSQMIVRDEMKRCTFYEENGRIKIGPY